MSTNEDTYDWRADRCTSDNPAKPYTDHELEGVRRALHHYGAAHFVPRLVATIDAARSEDTGK